MISSDAIREPLATERYPTEPLKHISADRKRTLCGMPLQEVERWANVNFANGITCKHCEELKRADQ